MLKDLLQDYKDWLDTLKDELNYIEKRLEKYETLSDYDFHQLNYKKNFYSGEITMLETIINDMEKC